MPSRHLVAATARPPNTAPGRSGGPGDRRRRAPWRSSGGCPDSPPRRRSAAAPTLATDAPARSSVAIGVRRRSSFRFAAHRSWSPLVAVPTGTLVSCVRLRAETCTSSECARPRSRSGRERRKGPLPMSTEWRPLRGVDQRRLSEARVQAHYAAQWLGRVARAYVPARPDDSHTNLGWDDPFDGLATHALPGGQRVALRLADLTLAVLDADGKPVDALALDGRRDADAAGWLGAQMAARGVDRHALAAPLPYEMPAHAIASGAAYTALGEALRELADWFANADAALGAVTPEIGGRKLHAPPVRCRPHHFCSDTLH